MKIVLFIHSLRAGGAERVTTHMANYWAEEGHDVTILTMAPAIDNQYSLSAKINQFSLNTEHSSSGLYDAILNNISRVKTLRNAIKKMNVDVVISMMTEANIIAALACINLPIKSIGSERIHPEEIQIGLFWNTLRRFCYYGLDVLVTQTKSTELWIKSHTFTRKTVTIPNPVVLPLPIREPIVIPKINEGNFLILGAGRLTAQKQFTHLIKAFATISDDHPNWSVAIIGEGEDHQKLSKLIKRLKLDQRITLVGRVGNVHDWYKIADIFALTSLTEGFPNVLIEAMLHNTAVVSYDCPTGPSDIIKQEENGFLVERNNIQLLASALDHLCLLYTSPSPRDQRGSRMPSSA